MRVLITGGAGFIGSHTVDLLLQQPDISIFVLDNLSSGKIEYLNLAHPNVSFMEGDILEYPLIKELIENCDVVLHLAAIPSVSQSLENPIYASLVNTQGLLHILQAIREVNPHVRLVYASSAALYGDIKQLPVAEEMNLQPCSPYALQKQHCEQYADLYHRLFGIASIGLRYFNVYGTRQDPHSPYSGVISRFMDAYKRNEVLTVYGDGMQSRDFIHIDDVARANLFALQNKSKNCFVLNIATGQPYTLMQLIRYIEEAGGGHPAKIAHLAEREGDIKFSYANVNRAKTLLSFQALVSLQTGINSLLKSDVL